MSKIDLSVHKSIIAGETKCVKYHVITHRIKSAPEHHKHHRRHSTSSTSVAQKPVYPTFTLDRLNPFDGTSALEKRFDPHSNMFDGAEARLAIHDNELEHAPHRQRRYGGKRGRPVVIGRAIYGRGRMHFRPTTSHQTSPRVAQTAKITEMHSPVPEHRDVATHTEHERAVQTEAQPPVEETVPKDEVEELVEEDTESTITPESVKHHVHHKKPPVPKKMPFVGSGQKVCIELGK
ncbi:unnamed protein product [Cylicostephanus goldi]|uniref:Uncharacterized protein n=1 Tax=Cylicostephanus goldi TaxID=71465 RepID=A0A3P6UEK7_CYLGO|nr:unnamed protein product [Cylicostephanus goldi]